MYKLLVVDDEPKIREVIREYAEFNGYEVTEAEDGMSAVGLCKGTNGSRKRCFREKKFCIKG